ncbi:MAG: metallophosphoesterase [Pseudomonadota bacterium]
MSLIVHLSDTHFGTEQAAVVIAAQRAIAQLRPDVVVLTGDITQRAHRGQFDAAKQFLNTLAVPSRLIIPGNHDIPLINLPVRLLAPYAGYRRVFGAPESLLCKQDVGIVGFDTTSRWRHTDGFLDGKHLTNKIAQARMQLASDAIVIACVHQPLHTLWAEDHTEVLDHATTTAACFAIARVDIVLSGHVHVPLATTTQEIFPTLTHHFILAGAGTALSHRTRRGVPNSFNAIHVNPDPTPTIALTRYDFDGASGEFIARPVVRFTKGTDGWSKDG